MGGGLARQPAAREIEQTHEACAREDDGDPGGQHMLGIGEVALLDGTVDTGEVVLVTIEPAGGVHAPTTEPIVGTEALGSWYGGLGNTRLQMIACVVVMLLNVLLNWALIYGHLGLPRTGAPVGARGRSAKRLCRCF